MAENKELALAIVESIQKPVGNALVGGSAAVAGGGSSQAEWDIWDQIRSISQNSLRVLGEIRDKIVAMLTFDKKKFNQDRRAKAVNDYESGLTTDPTPTGSTVAEDSTPPGIFKIAGGILAGLAYFLMEVGKIDWLRIPGQLIAFRGYLRATGLLSKQMGLIRGALQPFLKLGQKVKLRLQSSFITPFLKKIDDFKLMFKGWKPLAGFKFPVLPNVFAQVGKNFDTFVVEPVRALGRTIKGWGVGAGIFGEAGALSKLTGNMSKILSPITAVARGIGKLFIPITILFGIFDGIKGFQSEYAEDKSVLDGIRGAIKGIVDGFVGTFVRLITDLLGAALEFLGLDNLGKFISEFGEKITKSLETTIGGIVDIITGIFSLDWDRIKEGFGNLFAGAGSFFFEVLTAPLNMAVNFIKDIFKWGDPEKPFNMMDWLIGPEGIVGKVWSWFKGLFSFNIEGIANPVSLGRIIKALTAAAGSAVWSAFKFQNPFKAFHEKFQEILASGGSTAVAASEVTGSGGHKTIDSIAGTSDVDLKANVISVPVPGHLKKKKELAPVDGTGKNNALMVSADQNTNTVVSNAATNVYTGKLTTDIDVYAQNKAHRLSLYG